MKLGREEIGIETIEFPVREFVANLISRALDCIDRGVGELSRGERAIQRVDVNRAPVSVLDPFQRSENLRSVGRELSNSSKGSVREFLQLRSGETIFE
jgi:hypothetical protein